MSMPGMWEIALVAIICMVLFGSKRLPEIGRSIGKGLRSFKEGFLGEINEKDSKEEEKGKVVIEEDSGRNV